MRARHVKKPKNIIIRIKAVDAVPQMVKILELVEKNFKTQ